MKPDALQIEQCIRSLPSKPWLADTNRARWPFFLFRVDDVVAAASILQSGRLYSRNQADSLGVLGHDAASPGVIQNSPDWIKNYVRLYFRPRTPTEYRSEGFRVTEDFELGAHRPMPVVMVFSSIPILTANGTEFTEGNAATFGTPHGSDVAFLRRIPFEKVYHDSAFTASERAEIVYRRCAEVLVPTELDLTHLKRIVCRSQAEHETLLNSLPEATKNTYAARIGVAANAHHKRWTFVESADLSNESVTIRFSPTTRSPGPFDAKVIFADTKGREIGHWRNKTYIANGTLKFILHNIGNPTDYLITLSLDGNLGYRGRFKAKEELL